MRKPLGRLAIAVLASIAIPLAVAPVALASAPALATSSASKSFKDNAATGIDLPNGFGILRIASATGLPSDIKSSHFDVVEKAFQAEEDGRYWDVKVKLKDGHSFKKGDVKASWHCPGHGPKPTKTPSSSTKPPKPPTTPPTSTSHKPPTTPPTTPPVETSTSKPDVPATSTSKPAPGGGDVVDCPVKPVPVPEKPAGGDAPATKPAAQVPFAPVGGVETGFGFLAG